MNLNLKILWISLWNYKVILSLSNKVSAVYKPVYNL